MTGRAALTAIGPSGVRRYRIRLLRGHRRSNAPVATDRSAPARYATLPAARQRPLPDAESFGGEVSFELPHITRSPRRRLRARPVELSGRAAAAGLVAYFTRCHIDTIEPPAEAAPLAIVSSSPEIE